MEKKCEDLAAVVNSICEGVRLLPPGPYSQELRHIEFVIEAKLILDFAPQVGESIVAIFEDFPEIKSFKFDIDERIEGGEYEEVKTHHIESLYIGLIDGSCDQEEMDDLEEELRDELMDVISGYRFDEELDKRYHAFRNCLGSVYEATGGVVSSSRAIYENRKEMSPMAMYTASAPDRFADLMSQKYALFEIPEQSAAKPNRPRG